MREGGARRADFSVISDVLALTCRGAVVMSDQTQRPKPNASGDRNMKKRESGTDGHIII